jgi:hypothetical protein
MYIKYKINILNNEMSNFNSKYIFINFVDLIFKTLIYIKET